MVTNIEYALMSGRAYQTNTSDINRFPVPQGWAEFFHVPGNPTFPTLHSGFEAVSFQRGNEIVISYAGTDPLWPDSYATMGLTSGLGSDMLTDAARYFLEVKKNNPEAQITFTGHSLGGGLAALVSVFFSDMNCVSLDGEVVTFDQAPFSLSATTWMRDQLLEDLLALRDVTEQPIYTLEQLTALVPDFITSTTFIDSAHTESVRNIHVEGELVSTWTPSLFGQLGHQELPLDVGSTGISSIDLHKQSLLTAFLQSDQCAANNGTPDQTLSQVTKKLTDLLGMIFDRNLYAHPTDDPNNVNFLEHLIRHQEGLDPNVPNDGDAMLSRFTADLWKIAQDGGLTMANNDLTKALTAFAMQAYYDNRLAANETLFEADTPAVTGGIRFDRGDVADNLFDDAKGFYLYFRNYLLTIPVEERAVIYEQLPDLRDWYIQAGRQAMTATADVQRAFMLGGSGNDILTGGSQADVLIGNGGQDTLDGGGGDDVLITGWGINGLADNESDTLRGGSGNDALYGGAGSDTLSGGTGDDLLIGGAGVDTYIIDGNDTIRDTGRNLIVYQGEVLAGAFLREGTSNTYRFLGDNSITLTFHSPGHMVVSGTDSITFAEQTSAAAFENGDFGITLYDAVAAERIITGTEERNWITLMKPSANTSIFGIWGGGGGISGDNIYNNLGWFGFFLSTAPPAMQSFGEGGNDLIYGLSGSDYIDGGDGDDVICGEMLYANLWGALGNGDTLLGGKGQDVMIGTSGKDVVSGGEDNDFLDGCHGNDTLNGDGGSDVLTGGTGDDQLFGGTGNDLLCGDSSLSVFGSTHSILVNSEEQYYWDADVSTMNFHAAFGDMGYATSLAINGFALVPDDVGNDQLTGGAGNDILIGGGGNDTLLGGTDHDRLEGGSGDDYLDGGDGNDLLLGDDSDDSSGGNDTLYGGSGDDELFGNGGNDILVGGTGNDQLHGDSSDTPVASQGSDYLDGGDGNDVLLGYGGDDTLIGGAGDDELQGHNGNDTLRGGDGSDELYGDAGNDVLDGEGGDDYLDGGDGSDVYRFCRGSGYDMIYDSGSTGGDTVLVAAGIAPADISVRRYAEHLVFSLDGGDDELMLTNWFASGGATIERFEFAGGTVWDASAISSMFESAGNPLPTDGSGDALPGGNPSASDLGDTPPSPPVPEGDTGGGGYVRYSSDFGLVSESDPALIAQQIFRLQRLAEAAAEKAASHHVARRVLLGSIYGDYLRGGNSNNYITGKAGNDYLSGGTGNDSLYAGTGNDVLDGGKGDDEMYGGSGNDTLFGSAGNDYLDGGPGNDTLNGGADIDYLADTSGNNTLNGGDGDDQLLSGSGDDILNGGKGDDFLMDLYGGNNLLNGEDGNDDLRCAGSNGNNTLIGGAGNDNLSGGPGNDILDGGAGNDFLDGGAGNNVYLFGRGSGNDCIDGLAAGTIRFAAGISPEDVIVSRCALCNDNGSYYRDSDLVFSIRGTADRVAVTGWSEIRNIQVEFSNGTVWDTAILEATPIVGTNQDDIRTDRFHDFALHGGSFNDVFDGKAGNDELYGGQGDDIYSFGRGDGQDTIYEASGIDTIRFRDGIAPADVTVWLDSGNLCLGVSGSDEGITVKTELPHIVMGNYIGCQVERVEFSDGTVWDESILYGNSFQLQGTDDWDVMSGTVNNDIFFGLAGNDCISTGSGNDILEGGAGDDYLDGGAGNDILDGGGGNDRLFDLYGGNDVLDGSSCDDFTWRQAA